MVHPGSAKDVMVNAITVASEFQQMVPAFERPEHTEGPLCMGWLSYPVTVASLVAYVNIFNLIDGLDGLASGLTWRARKLYR